MSTGSIGTVGQQAQQATTGRNAFREVDLDDFLKLMIAELQNQDPLSPMDNAQILQQISQIREIESNRQLTETLEAVFLGQNMTTASGMIGKWIMQLSEDSVVEQLDQVDRVSIEEGVPKLKLGDRTIDLRHASDMHILSGSSGEALSETMDMVGKTIRGTTDGTDLTPPREITGRVYEVAMVGGKPKYHVDDHWIDPSRVAEVLPEGSSSTGSEGT